MGSLRFLLSRRWVLLALVVSVLGVFAWQLGTWQFDRLEERRDRNALVRANESAAPVPAGEVLSADAPAPEGAEWRRVTATGTYAAEDSVVVRYRTRAGQGGVEVVTPLVDGSGPALLVDRGWVGTENGAAPAAVPEPPSGEVTVTGYVRRDARGDSTRVTDGSTRAVDSAAIGEAIDREVYRGFVQLAEESPAAEEPLSPAGLPELDDGPHFFYGLQWWFFGLLAVGGFGFLAYDEWRRATGRAPDRQRPERAGGPDPAQRDRVASASAASPPASEPETSSRNWVR